MAAKQKSAPFDIGERNRMNKKSDQAKGAFWMDTVETLAAQSGNADQAPVTLCINSTIAAEYIT